MLTIVGRPRRTLKELFDTLTGLVAADPGSRPASDPDPDPAPTVRRRFGRGDDPRRHEARAAALSMSAMPSWTWPTGR